MKDAKKATIADRSAAPAAPRVEQPQEHAASYVPFDRGDPETALWYAVKDSESYSSLRCKLVLAFGGQEFWIAHELAHHLAARMASDHNALLTGKYVTKLAYNVQSTARFDAEAECAALRARIAGETR